MFLILVDSNNINPDLSLARYIRDYANLKGTKIKIFKYISIFLIYRYFQKIKGTKISCNQAGCGACVVTAKVPDLVSGSTKTMSINSVSFF